MLSVGAEIGVACSVAMYEAVPPGGPRTITNKIAGRAKVDRAKWAIVVRPASQQENRVSAVIMLYSDLLHQMRCKVQVARQS